MDFLILLIMLRSLNKSVREINDQTSKPKPKYKATPRKEKFDIGYFWLVLIPILVFVLMFRGVI